MSGIEIVANAAEVLRGLERLGEVTGAGETEKSAKADARLEAAKLGGLYAVILGEKDDPPSCEVTLAVYG